MRYLMCLVVILVTLWLWGISVQGQPLDGRQPLIKDYILSPLSKELVGAEGKVSGMPMTYKTLISQENLTDHDHFDWRLDVHYVTLFCAEENCSLKFQVKEYQEFVSPDSRGYVLWTLYDYDVDGKVDSAKRRFIVVMQDKVVMMVDYPEGFVDMQWYKPSKEEKQERFEKVINHWMSIVKTGT